MRPPWFSADGLSADSFIVCTSLAIARWATPRRPSATRQARLATNSAWSGPVTCSLNSATSCMSFTVFTPCMNRMPSRSCHVVPVMASTGAPSMAASYRPFIRWTAPGPVVARQTPSRPECLAMPSAMEAAASSCRTPTKAIWSLRLREASTTGLMPSPTMPTHASHPRRPGSRRGCRRCSDPGRAAASAALRHAGSSRFAPGRWIRLHRRRRLPRPPVGRSSGARCSGPCPAHADLTSQTSRLLAARSLELCGNPGAGGSCGAVRRLGSGC